MSLENLPPLRTSLAGRRLADAWSRALVAVHVRAALGLPAQCELLFDGEGLGSVADAGWRAGTELRLEVTNAFAGAPPLFAGEVTAVEQTYDGGSGRWVRVRAYDLLHRLANRCSVSGHRHLSVVDLARELVADTGLAVAAKEPGASRRYIVQHQQSDLDLLRRHAAALGLYATVDDGTLHLLSLEGSGDALALEHGVNLIEARFDVIGAPAWAAATGYGWDPETGDSAATKVSRPRAGPDVSWQRAEALGELVLVDLALEDGGQVEAACLAELDRAACRDLNFWGLATGDVALRPGVVARVRGVDTALEGRYVLTSVRHTLDRERGFVSEVSSYPPKTPEMQRGAEIVSGIVASVADPDKRGRVKARLPTFGDLETGWLRVVAPGLGRERGFIALPDVGDEVAIAFNQGDPARGLILGSIHDGRGPFDAGVAGGRVRRFQLRAGAQLVELDEEHGALRLQNSAGSFLELTEKGVHLHSAGRLLIEAPGHRLRLRAKRIDLEKS